MKRITAKLPLLLILCALSACSSVTVKTDHDPSASFGAYKTYRLEPPIQGESLSPVSQTALRDTLRTQLAARGIAEASGAKADLLIAPHIFLTNKVAVQYNHYDRWPYRAGYGYSSRYGYYGMWAGAPRTYTTVTQYTQGTLVLDFVDTRTDKLVYRGVASAVAGGSEANADKIREAVTKIVEQMPTGGSQ